MSLSVDLNADLGEGAGTTSSCSARQLSQYCLRVARRKSGDDESIDPGGAGAWRGRGAHPGFDDRENFGRREISLSAEESSPSSSIRSPPFTRSPLVRRASATCETARRALQHGGPQRRDGRRHRACGQGNRSKLIFFAPVASALSRAAESNELHVAREVFADRNYMPDGTLVSRDRPDAMLHDPVEAANRVYGMLCESKVHAIDGSEVHVEADTICLHGDNPEAVGFRASFASRSPNGNRGRAGREIAALTDLSLSPAARACPDERISSARRKAPDAFREGLWDVRKILP